MKNSVLQTFMFIISAFLIISCQKEELLVEPVSNQSPALEKRFFEIGFIENGNSLIRQTGIQTRSRTLIDEAYNALMEENEQNNFVPYLIREYGFPVWSHADYHVSEANDQHRVYVPMAFTVSSEISAYLICQSSKNTYTFRLVPKYYLESLQSSYCSESIGNKFLLAYGHILEESVFGASNILPNEIFTSCPFNAFSSNEENIQIRSSTYEICITFCVNWSNEVVTAPDIGGILCNLIFGLTNSCPNPNPAHTTVVFERDVCTQYETQCYEVTIFEVEDIPDHDGTGNWWGNQNKGTKNTNGQNVGGETLIVDLRPHLRRIELCEGYLNGEVNDTGADNPESTWQDADFCEQIKCIREQLAFLWEDNDLLAWYMWYDANYGERSWEQMVAFACNGEFSPTLKEEGIRLFEEEQQCLQMSWKEFEEVWRKIMQIVKKGVHVSLEERKWLACHPQETEIILDFLMEEGTSPTVISTSEIIIGLISKNLQNLSPGQLSLNQQKVANIINQSFLRNDLQDRLQISPDSWYQMFQNEWNNDDGGIFQFLLRQLKSVHKTISEGWDWIKDKQAMIVSSLQDLQDEFPSNYEEWSAFISVMAPLLLDLGVDIGTDFIPIVGEVKAFNNSMNAFNSGNNGEAALEFLAGLGGILPIGDILKAGAKVANAAVTTIRGFKVVKALSRVSGAIFSRIKHFTAQGWKIVWEDGIGKLFLKNPSSTFHSEISQGMARSMDDLSEFPFALNEEALTLSADVFDEGLDALDAIEDAVQTSGSNDWQNLRPFFERGNSFNRKAKNEAWYDYHEVHLTNGKRLDSYDPDLGEIVSRKATDFDNIQLVTFEKYLQEIDSKYSPGTIIRSNKYPDLDGQTLHGTKIIEVPTLNQNSANLSNFESLANQYSTIIRFKSE